MRKLVLASNKEHTKSLKKIITDINEDLTEDFLCFLAPARINELKNYFDNHGGTSSENDVQDLQSIWRGILIDAIYFLRINDYREKAFSHKKGGSKEKTTMRTERIEEVAASNVYGIEDLFNYFEQFTEFENTLYGADKYYRDHLIHPIWVWIIGLHILKSYGHIFNLRVCSSIRIENAFHADESWFDNPEELRLSTAELSAMWAIIALTHDLGYPLEKVEKINDQLEKMLSQFGKIKFSRSRFNFETQHDHLVRFLLNFISSVANTYFSENDASDQEKSNKRIWITHKRTKYFTKFAKSWEMFDHGIVSSLILLKSLTFFIESDHSSDYVEKLSNEDARQFSIRSEILHAIASHTTPKIYHLSTNNLPFLLILCDDLQEWSRPTLGDMRAGIKGSATNVTIEKCEIEKIDSDRDVSRSTIHCSIKYEDKLNFREQKKFAERVFKVWYERFRPALDDDKRVIDFSWKLKFGKNIDWHMQLDTGKDVYEPFSYKGPLESRPTSKTETYILYK